MCEIDSLAAAIHSLIFSLVGRSLFLWSSVSRAIYRSTA